MTVEVKNCQECPFFKNSFSGFFCGHPMLPIYGRYILSPYDIKKSGSKVAEKCPLKTDEVKLTTYLLNETKE